jgi:gamma-glutamyltranspeptidase/glutathione hydrolase
MPSAPDAAAPHRTQNWHVRKPSARGHAGMVVSQVGAAAEAGVLMLDAGGSAADAAVATAFALAAVEPWNSGLGGIGFAQVMGPGGPAETFDFGPVAPAGLDPGAFPLTGRNKQDLFAWPEVEGDRNIHGPLSFVIPSAVAGYALLHERHGRLPLRDVLAPAVALAKRGLPADWYTTLKVAFSAAVLRLYPESARIYLPNGLPPIPPYQGTPGFFPWATSPPPWSAWPKPALRDFYEGEVAASIARDVRESGRLLSAADLAGCRARVLPAVEVPWAGAAPHARQRPHRGADPPAGAGRHGRRRRPAPRARRRVVRALRPHNARRLRRAPVRPGRRGAARRPESCTTHLTACDRDGMMVAMTTTLLSSMGSRVVLPRSGRAAEQRRHVVRPDAGAANAMAPGQTAR